MTEDFLLWVIAMLELSMAFLMAVLIGLGVLEIRARWWEWRTDRWQKAIDKWKGR